jgi:bisphosphoglycerate-dependent phosphoglycerate mutase
MATTTGTAGSALPAAGGTSTAGLADWASPYITDYLAQAKALGNQDYQVYAGPLTAAESNLQTQAFQGIGNLTVPTGISSAATDAQNLAKTAGNLSYSPTNFSNAFTAPGEYSAANFSNTFKAPDAYTASDFSNFGFQAPDAYQSVGGSFTDTGVAARYMNPFLQQALDPQMKEMQRQADIQRIADAGRMTQAGAFGGGRQAIMESEGRRNLLDKQSEALGTGYANAYDKAATQFNSEQARKIEEAKFGAEQGMNAAELRTKYGLDAAKAAELSRQFGAKQGLDSADIAAKYGLESLKAAELSRQFGATQGMTAAELKAKFGLDAAKAAEQSKQFGAGYGLDALSRQREALETQGRLSASSAEQERANYEQILKAGAAKRAIDQEGITADLDEFNNQRKFDYDQVKFMRDMISGLPTGSVTNEPNQLSGIAQFITAAGGIDKLLTDTGVSDLNSLLRKFGLNLDGGEVV